MLVKILTMETIVAEWVARICFEQNKLIRSVDADVELIFQELLFFRG